MKTTRDRGNDIVVRALAGLTAVSVWFSLGIAAVTSDDTQQRIAALPPFWLLLALVVAAVAAAWRLTADWRTFAPLSLSLLLWLPFIPGRIPAAFLIWQGPIEIGVWIFAVAGVLASIVPPRWFDAWPCPATAPWIVAILSATMFSIGAVAVRRQVPVGDEPHYLMITQSLLKDGDLRIENNYKNRDYASFYPVDIEPHYLTRGADGQIYSSHAPGVSILVLPAFALFGYYGAVAMVIACTALAAALCWLAAWRLTSSSGAAWAATIGVFTSAPVFLQSMTVFPDGVGTLPVAAGLWALIVLDAGGVLTTGQLLAVGSALATLPWLHSRLALLAGALGAAVWVRVLVSDRKRAVLFALVPAIAAILWFGFFWWYWGSPSPAAPWGAGLTEKIEWIPQGVLGLLFDQQTGLLFFAPVYLVAAAGWVMLARRRFRLAIEIAVGPILLLLTSASYSAWWGGAGAPARHIMTMLPIAVAPIAFGVATGGSRARASALVSIIAGVLILLPKTLLGAGAFAFEPEGGPNPLVQLLATSVQLVQALPSLVIPVAQHFEPEAWRPALPGIAIWVGAGAAAGVTVVVSDRRSRMPFTMVAFAAAAAIMAAASGVWTLQSITGVSPLGSQLAFIEHWKPPRLPVGVEWRRPWLAQPEQLARRIELSVPAEGIVNFPPGQFEVVVDSASGSPSELIAAIGDSPLPLERWNGSPSSAPMTFALPVRTSRLRFESPAGQPAAVRLRLSAPRAADDQPTATRAASYGDVRVFFADNEACPEPAGFWVPATRDTHIVVDRKDGAERGAELRLKAGPVATTVDVTVDGVTRTLTIEAEQRQTVALPARRSDAWSIIVRPRNGFRPVDVNPELRDYRNLGAWIELF